MTMTSLCTPKAMGELRTRLPQRSPNANSKTTIRADVLRILGIIIQVLLITATLGTALGTPSVLGASHAYQSWVWIMVLVKHNNPRMKTQTFSRTPISLSTFQDQANIDAKDLRPQGFGKRFSQNHRHSSHPQQYEQQLSYQRRAIPSSVAPVRAWSGWISTGVFRVLPWKKRRLGIFCGGSLRQATCKKTESPRFLHASRPESPAYT